MKTVVFDAHMNYIGGMRFAGRLMVVAGAVWIGAAYAETTDARPNPYQAIVDRNPFGLRPPPTPPPPAPPKKNDPPPNLNFTGITGDGEGKKAWLVASVPGKQPPLVYYSLGENEKQDDVEVVEINSKEESVKILLRGEPITLTFKDNAMKAKALAHAAAIAAQPGQPGQPGLPPGGAPPPTGAPAVSGPVILGRNGQVISGGAPESNGFVTTPPPTAQNGNVTDVTGQFNNGSNLRSIPQRPLRTVTPQERASGEEYAARQLINATVNNAQMENKGIPMPPLPGLPQPQQ